MKVHMKVQKRLQVRVHEGWDPSSGGDPGWVVELDMNSVSPDETSRGPTGDSAYTDEILRMGAEPHARTRAVSNHDESQQSAADQ